ncbi:MAG TPA: glucoamylase family protein [Acidobacteriaceae bacterium]|nr:glucoamylase family protein [Acidobacteriaceae bacterium]
MSHKKITRRQLLRTAGASGALVLGAPVVSLAAGLQNQREAPPVKTGQQPTTESEAAEKYQHGLGVFFNRPLTQISKEAEVLLDDLEGRGCDYFYNEVSPKSGLVRDHAPLLGPSFSRISSIAATGFGLSALCIAARRNYLLPNLCEARVEKTLAFLLEECPQEHGFLYHYIDLESGERLFGSELSSIDTSLLLCGVLLCRQYFSGNSRIEALATAFYRRIDWPWMMNGGKALAMGWLPDQGFLSHRWDIYAELLLMYLMAIGSPTHPIPAQTWNELERPVIEYGGIQYISGVAPLFIHQYAHAWCDFRNKRDLHTNYFTNSIAATRCHQLWCLVLGRKYPWINQDMWGITASESKAGYRAWGGPPSMGPLDGTLVPCATAGSLPFLPAECSHVLLSIKRNFGDKVYRRYGFVDAFNPKTKWFAEDVLGIDQGISVLMAENLRTGFVWEYFMKNTEITHAMDEVQFHPDPDANRQVL